MTETITVSPLREAERQAAEAMSRFPSDSDHDKERRSLQAALHVPEIRDAFPTLTSAREHLARKYHVSERQVRRAGKILPYPEVVNQLLMGSISVTNAAHVIEHAGLGMLRIAWACAPEDARRKFYAQISPAGREAGK
jgi:hypothetical protein